MLDVSEKQEIIEVVVEEVLKRLEEKDRLADEDKKSKQKQELGQNAERIKKAMAKYN